MFLVLMCLALAMSTRIEESDTVSKNRREHRIDEQTLNQQVGSNQNATNSDVRTAKK